VNACGEHVNPESTCTIRLCLWKQESPDFRQGRVQLYEKMNENLKENNTKVKTEKI
jgi:hypothetical protein